MEVKQICDHLEKEIGQGGYTLYMAAYKGMEVASRYGVSQRLSTFSEEDLKNAVSTFERHLKLNGTNYDRILVGAELKKIKFESEWNSLSEDERWMIEIAIPEIFDDPYLKILNTVPSLVRIANRRIREAGFKETCKRCTGLGRYSRNFRRDTTCYKCKGAKNTIPRLTKKIRAEIEKEFLGNHQHKGGVIY